MSDGRFETYYAPGLGTKYAVRSWIISAVIAAVGIPVTWFTFVGNPQWWVLVLVGLVFGFLLLLSVLAALGARAKWGSDDGLALRLDETGLTLPRVGTLAWDEITAISIVDTGDVHGSAPFRAWEVLTGSSGNRFVSVFVTDADAVVARTHGAAVGAKTGAVLDGRGGFHGVWGEGLRAPGWDETVAALNRAADRHGIRVHGRKITADS